MLTTQANERLEKLRRQIRMFSQQYDFDELLQHKGKVMFDDWHKFASGHPHPKALGL